MIITNKDILVSEEDRKLFAEIMKNPPEPNKALIMLAEDYKLHTIKNGRRKKK